MTRVTRELQLCEIVRAPIAGGRGRGSFVSRVSRLLRLGYVPLGSPHYSGNTATLTLLATAPVQQSRKEEKP